MWLVSDSNIILGGIMQWAFLLWLAVAQATYSSAPIPPSEDPFYTAPSGFESCAPGTVLRIRSDPSNITSVVNCSAAYNILYRTTDTMYRPSWAVTTILIPHLNLIPANSTSRLLSYQIAYNSVDVDASPSYLLSNLYSEGPGRPPTADFTVPLSRGWYINVPDFEGPLASFFAGPQEGYAVLDSIRAILSQSQLADWKNARYALWGYSGGSLATVFAAEVQALYAPELSFVGTAVGGLTSNVTEAFQNFNGGPSAGFIVSVLLGVTAQYPEARKYLVSNLKTQGPFNATGFLMCLHYNEFQYLTIYAGQDIFEYFVNGSDILMAPEMIHVIGNNVFPTYHGIPQMPLFAYHAIPDEVVSIDAADLHIQRYCDVSVDVLYERNTVGNHGSEGINGSPRALEWLIRWLEGNVEQTITGCTVNTITFSGSQS